MKAPNKAIDFIAHTSQEERLQLSELTGKAVVLSFFRYVSCPFCAMRTSEYDAKFQQWNDLGITVIAVFSSSNYDIREFTSHSSRPFMMVGDPKLDIYDKYAVEHASFGVIKSFLLRFPRFINGYRLGAKVDFDHPHGDLLPADFLISPKGKIVATHYGRHASDHMPMKRIERFTEKVRLAREKQRKKREARGKTLSKKNNGAYQNDQSSVSMSEMSAMTVEDASHHAAPFRSVRVKDRLA